MDDIAFLKKVDKILNDLLDDLAVEKSKATRAKDFTGSTVIEVVATSLKGTIAIVNIYLKERVGF